MSITKREVLDKLLGLDHSTYPIREINNLIQQLGKYGAMVFTLHAGKEIVRARVNCNFEVFTKASELSYKPAQLNNSFQRASTPNTTMFYGSVIPEGLKEGELNSSRLIGLTESSRLMRDKKLLEGEQTITFGKWRVTQDIHIVSIVHHNDYLEQNSITKQMHDDYDKFIRAYSQDIIDDSLMISEFFADQFAKSDTPNDFDYLLSAVYAERMTKMKIGDIQLSGVLYPSVRTEGKGFNVAFTPWSADNCLQLEVVAECTLYKKGKHIMVDNDKQAVLKPGQKEFILEPITDEKVHLGRETIYKILNGEIKVN